MNRFGIFDIIGPIMVGPSSSHTAGSARLALFARKLAGDKVVKVDFYLYGSFAKTYKGHGTDKALLAGMLGFEPDDDRLRNSFELAKKDGLEFNFIPSDDYVPHPNTVKFVMTTIKGETHTVIGCSIGGGNVVIKHIDGIDVSFTGKSPIIVTVHNDTPGVIALITTALYERQVNIGNMRVNRDDENGTASMYIELDADIDYDIIDSIKQIAEVQNAILLKP